MIAAVYRPELDWKGQPVDLDGSHIGDVVGVIVGGQSAGLSGPSVQPVRDFPALVSTEGLLGVPWSQDSGVVVQQHDRLAVDGTWYAVTSDRLWTGENIFTGTQPSYYFVEIRSTT